MDNRAEIIPVSSARLCPGCVSGDCSTTTQVSGLPIVQLIVATSVGFIWAAIFIWLYASFYEGEGYGYAKRSSSNKRVRVGKSSILDEAEEAFGRNIPSMMNDYRSSGRNLISAANFVLDAIHYLGDKFL